MLITELNEALQKTKLSRVHRQESILAIQLWVQGKSNIQKWNLNIFFPLIKTKKKR